MEAFYDGDLKDIWDSDLDPSDTLKLTSDTDMHDWFLERDVKIPAVILNDKLISDALLGTLPIKSEHSYSLNSDGDSIPDSPRSLRTKIDDMEDECYPAISMKTATSNTRCSTMDTNCSMAVNCSSSQTSLVDTLAATSNPLLTSVLHNTSLNSSFQTNEISKSTSSSNLFSGINKMASSPQTINLRSLNNNFALKQQQQQQQQQHQMQQMESQQQTTHFTKRQEQWKLQEHQQSRTSLILEAYQTTAASSREGSISPDICSDIEIDESYIKDEPMSPESSCPPSPNSHIYASSASSSHSSLSGSHIGDGSFSLNMANVAAFTNSDLVFEHKNGSLQLTPASQSLLKSQQFVLGTTGQSIVIPKVNIKVEQQLHSIANTTTSANTNVTTGVTGSQQNSGGPIFGLPPTPPSSMPSDESEGNRSPEHMLSPMSPPTSSSSSSTANAAQQLLQASGSGSSCSAATPASSVTARRSTTSSSCSSTSHSPSSSHHGNGNNSGRIYTGSSTRQPIHTPLISSQPKGSTGTLLLTEEEKRTLLAEGYPIPTRLPLTKAEEKSLKKIRRKIKNKISAQESRRKKKEYMDQLERKVEILVSENIDYKKRVEVLEDSNASLLNQLQKLQALVNKQQKKA